ncbi:prolyl oligopeptidase family serine peptidase [Streptomyces sp. NPDC000658]|uniref:prolyl oligopeptidase family serine peptidase n=1 Tax=Streptomyces sp. NPDC000658 TaxID=3154266 RepID=UPI00332AC7F9
MPSNPLLPYPAARRQDLEESLFGRSVADPYRWLEQHDSEETRSWLAEQDSLRHAALDSLPGRAQLRTHLNELISVGVIGPPVWRGTRHFFMKREPQQEHAALYMAEEDGSQRLLIDPMDLDPTGHTTLDSWYPDRTGTRLTYQVSAEGDADSHLYVFDTASGAVVDGPITRCRHSPVAWLPSGDAFYYVRSLPSSAVPKGEEHYHRRVYLHHVGTDPDTDDSLVFGADGHKTTSYGIAVTADGRRLVLTATIGAVRHNEVWLADLTTSSPLRPVFTPVQRDVQAHTRAFIGRRGQLYLHTDRHAPQGRLAVTDIENPQSSPWRDILPPDPDARLEHVAMLESPKLARPLLLAGRNRHTFSEITVHDLATGEHLDDIELPGPGIVGEIRARGHEAWFTYTDPFTPPTVFHWDALTGTRTIWASPPGRKSLPSRPPGAVHHLNCASPDGTQIRVTVFAPHSRRGPLPTILYGYGGFGLSLAPAYNPEILAWVEAGGVYAVAHVRGGDEGGPQWHAAGARANKQKSVDDFHAAAESLIRGGWTTSSQLVISGESNGGLLVGAALTQRPDLYRAVLCGAPVLDMARYERFGLGPSWTVEYGSAEVEEELGWLMSYSPYHRVNAEGVYPAVLFSVSEGDSMVDPMHARKMCAALQHVAGCRPTPGDNGIVLLRREPGAGHGARSMSLTVGLLVDQLAFAAWQSGLPLESSERYGDGFDASGAADRQHAQDGGS